MRVFRRVAVTGKVLARGQEPGRLQPSDPGHAEASARIRISAEGAVADDRIVRTGIDVEDGCEGDRETYRRELRADRTGDPQRERRIVPGRDGSHGGHVEQGRAQARYASAFLIDADERRIRRSRVDFPRQCGDLLRAALHIGSEEDGPPTAPFAQRSREARWQRRAGEPADDERPARADEIHVVHAKGSGGMSVEPFSIASRRSQGLARGESGGRAVLAWAALAL